MVPDHLALELLSDASRQRTATDDQDFFIKRIAICVNPSAAVVISATRAGASEILMPFRKSTTLFHGSPNVNGNPIFVEAKQPYLSFEMGLRLAEALRNIHPMSFPRLQRF